MKRIPSIAILSFLSLVGCATSTEQTDGSHTEIFRSCIPYLNRAESFFWTYAVPSDDPTLCIMYNGGGSEAVGAELHSLPCEQVGTMVIPGTSEVRVVGNVIASGTVEGSTRAEAGELVHDVVIDFGGGRVYRLAGRTEPTRSCSIRPSNP